MTVQVGGVDAYSWNPVRPVRAGRLASRLPARLVPTAPVNNFGDLIGPMVVARMHTELGLGTHECSRPMKLLSVGSVMHFASSGDVVWGSGVNGKVVPEEIPGDLDVRAVRGPRTHAFLTARGIHVPEVYGDPALLWPHFWPREHYLDGREPRGVTIVPNLHDWRQLARDPRAVNPRRPVHEVVGAIARSELVVGSSLHGVVLAEAMGIPARFVTAGAEPAFKYEDYLLGSGRAEFHPGSSVEHALRLGGQQPLRWDAAPLRASFPADLWPKPAP